jgi:NAD(P)-dependent dehydrogenase (short-subunit alcohol dehydrogenase family)
MPEQRVALVTGGSRGVGRGVAISLAEAGYKVYATGRTIETADLPSAVVRVRCDHLRDEETAAVFSRIGAEARSLDVLVNSSWGGYEAMVENGVFTWSKPFWERSFGGWTGMMEAGVRAGYVCSAHAARMMLPRGRGLIANISFWAAQKHIGNVLYGISKAATDKLAADTAHELRPHGIAAVSLYPGLVRTEAVMAAAAEGWLDLSNSESPEFSGLVIAALARDPALMDRSGKVLVIAALAEEYGLADVDGRRPRPLTLETL